MSSSNPLRDPADRRLPRIAGPSGLVIFGVTGDLSRKKLMPAVYDLANRGLLPPGFSLVGFARREWANEDFAQEVHDAVKEHARTPFREEVWQQLIQGMRFVQGTFDDDGSFERLRATIEELDKAQGTGGNFAFYLSVPPRSFPVVIQQLKKHGRSCGAWRRAASEAVRPPEVGRGAEAVRVSPRRRPANRRSERPDGSGERPAKGEPEREAVPAPVESVAKGPADRATAQAPVKRAAAK
ncbi:Glucose-6-phosphate 1-dehydrogenase [Streptomyces griseomycini]